MKAESEHGDDEKDVDIKHCRRSFDIKEVLEIAVNNGDDQRDEGSLQKGEQNLGADKLVFLLG